MAGEGFSGVGGYGVGAAGGTGGGSETSKVGFTRSSIKYDSPFLDMTNSFIPKTIKGMFKFIASCVLTDPIVYQCVVRSAEYPITPLNYSEFKKSNIKDDQTVANWKTIFEKKLKIIKTIHQMGMDLHAYGSSLASIHFPFKRMLKCKACGKTNTPEAAHGLAYQNHTYMGTCRDCGKTTSFDAFDMDSKEYDKLRIVLWDLLFVDIKYNNITGDHFFYYTPPPNIVSDVKNGDLDIINALKLPILNAIKDGKRLTIDSNNVFYWKQCGPQYFYPSERGWGVPSCLPILKESFHAKILKKGNEMIAFDHIIPMRMVFPQGTGDVSPHATINLGSWREKIETEFRKWKVDPNHIAICPLPVGVQNFGGEGKMLMTTQEIKMTEDTIITGMGIIPEIIKGGAPWSGSNVSLRIVENKFLNHRTDAQDFISWVEDCIHRYYDIPKMNITMTKFKMADDFQKKSLIVSSSMGPSHQKAVSISTARKELDLDPDEEFKLILEESKKASELRIRDLETEALSTGKSSLISAKYNADAQAEFNNRLQSNSIESAEIRMVESNNRMKSSESDIVGENGNNGIPINQLLMHYTTRYAQLAQIDPSSFKLNMLAMRQTMPNTYLALYNNLKDMEIMSGELVATLQPMAMPMPEQQPSPDSQSSVAAEPMSPPPVAPPRSETSPYS